MDLAQLGEPLPFDLCRMRRMRRFLDLRSMFQNDTKAAIAEVERGEGYLPERFETYMADQSLSTATRNLIRSTYQRVRFDHARGEQLKQAQS